MHRSFYTGQLLNKVLLYKDAFAQSTLPQRSPSTEKPLHRAALHTKAFAHRRFYTKQPLHTQALTHRRFYTQTL